MPRAPVKTRARGNVVSNISPYYIGWWTMLQQMIPNGSGGLTYRNLTLANASTVVLADNWYTHADIGAAVTEGWLYAGAPIKLRSTGTYPGGTSNSVIYYADLTAGANRLRLGPTAADAIAGTNPLDIITTVGTGNSVIFPAHVTDSSGNGNDLLFGASCHDTVAWGDISVRPFLSSATNATNDQCVGRLPVAAFNAAWSWPNDSLLFMASMMMTDAMTLIRPICGNGAPTESDGPRMQTASVDAGKFAVVMRHGGLGALAVSLSQTAAAPFVEDVPVHVAWLFDANAMRGSIWINGYLDRNAQYDEPDGLADMVVTPVSDFRIGGSGAANSHAMGWRDVHLLSIPNTVSLHMPTLNDMILAMSGGNYNCFLDGDF